MGGLFNSQGKRQTGSGIKNLGRGINAMCKVGWKHQRKIFSITV